MGGGEAGGHRAVLALHMLTELRSFNAFHEMFTTQYPQLCSNFNCLRSIHTALQTETKVHEEHMCVYIWAGTQCMVTH